MDLGLRTSFVGVQHLPVNGGAQLHFDQFVIHVAFDAPFGANPGQGTEMLGELTEFDGVTTYADLASAVDALLAD